MGPDVIYMYMFERCDVGCGVVTTFLVFLSEDVMKVFYRMASCSYPWSEALS